MSALKKLDRIQVYLRSRQGGYRRLSERIRLYDEARRLEGSGISYYRIGQILGVDQGQIKDWLIRGARPRTDRYDPDLTPSPELAYLIGFWLGDGRNAGKQKKVRFKLADEEQIRYVNLLVARLLARDPKPVLMDGPFYVVDYDTSVLYDYIALPLKKLKPCIYQFKSDFLRGFFDAEGYASCSLNGSSRRLGSQVVGVANTNIEYLMIVQKLLRQLGIQSSIKTTNRKGGLMTIRGKTWRRKHDVRHLIVTGQESIRKFFDLVGFRNPTKQGKMSDLVRLFEFSPRVRFNWFVRHYEKRGSRWYRIRN